MYIIDTDLVGADMHDNFLKNEGIMNALESIFLHSENDVEFTTHEPFSKKSKHEVIINVYYPYYKKEKYIQITHEYKGDSVDWIIARMVDGKLKISYERFFDEFTGTINGNHIWYLNSKKINWTGFETKIEEFAVSLI